MQKYIGKRIFFSVSFLLLWFEINCGALKSNDIHDNLMNKMDKVIYPKGSISGKELPIKSLRKHKIYLDPKFQHLSKNDLAFIMDLDKQFAKYGPKIKIKVENGNVAAKRNGKNLLKRTLEKNLGYGYSKQYDNNHNPYEYNARKYMNYPYSQEDIMPQNVNYYLPQKKPITTVTIEPSYSFELETETYYQPSHHQLQDESLHRVPVLTLNIPGSQEYAAHLTNLLQQYLELKIAQYANSLIGKQTQKHTKGPSYNVNVAGPSSEIQYVYQSYVPQTEDNNYQKNFKLNDDQSYYASSSIADKSPNYYQNYEITVGQPIRPLLYFIPDKQFSQDSIGQSGNDNFTEYFLLSGHIRNQQHLLHLSEEYNNRKETSERLPALPLSENNPHKSHTRVIFTQNTKDAGSDYQSDYQLPSIKPKEFHPPTSIPVKHQDFQAQVTQEKQVTETEKINNNYNNNTEQIVSITQKPFNYHAYNTKQYSHGHGRHDIMVLTTYK